MAEPKETQFSVTLSTVTELQDLIEQLESDDRLWRGHSNSIWPLRPSFDRLINHPDAANKRTDRESYETIFSAHLSRFRDNLFGRRGLNPSLLNLDQVEALGQHTGLATRLLDWSYSPYVALFFAAFFNDTGQSIPCIWGLRTNAAKDNLEPIKHFNEPKERLEILRPLSDENARLIAQQGCFTRLLGGGALDRIVKFSPTEDFKKATLIKIGLKVNAEQRKRMFTSLTAMNISFHTLFPDLEGAARQANISTLMSKSGEKISTIESFLRGTSNQPSLLQSVLDNYYTAQPAKNKTHLSMLDAILAKVELSEQMNKKNDPDRLH